MQHNYRTFFYHFFVGRNAAFFKRNAAFLPTPCQIRKPHPDEVCSPHLESFHPNEPLVSSLVLTLPPLFLSLFCCLSDPNPPAVSWPFVFVHHPHLSRCPLRRRPSCPPSCTSPIRSCQFEGLDVGRIAERSAPPPNSMALL